MLVDQRGGKNAVRIWKKQLEGFVYSERRKEEFVRDVEEVGQRAGERRRRNWNRQNATGKGGE